MRCIIFLTLFSQLEFEFLKSDAMRSQWIPRFYKLAKIEFWSTQFFFQSVYLTNLLLKLDCGFLYDYYLPQ